MRSAKSLIGGCVAIALVAAAVVWLQVVRERRFPEAEPVQQVLYVSSPAVLTRLALSFDALVADLYWIRTIQYYGGTRLSDRSDKSYDLLYPLLDLTTSLDRNFNVAYRFGAYFLSERAPGGAGRPDLAIRLLEKGMAAQPQRYEHPYDIGFVHYRQGDFGRAADWFLRAANTPGAQQPGARADIWLRPLAANTLATGGDTRSSRVLYENLLNAESEWFRRDAERRLRQLDAIDEIARLERITMEYERRFGDPPRTWEDLVSVGYLPSVPVDPAGQRYDLNPWWGDVTLSEDSPLWPLPTERPA